MTTAPSAVRARARRRTAPWRTGALTIGAPVLLSGALITAVAAGLDPASPSVTWASLGAVALVGLPHGALDVARARAAGAERGPTIARYLAVAGAMAAVWALAPALALALFLAAAAWHFGEDWRPALAPAPALALGATLLALPAATHPTAVSAIFTALVGAGGAAIADALALALVPALPLATLGLARAARALGARRLRDTGAALAALALLPPLPGFALFFCVVHSPRHLLEALAELPPRVARRPWRVAVPVTALALAIGAGLHAWLPAHAVGGARVVASLFALLSVLTAPHLLLARRHG